LFIKDLLVGVDTNISYNKGAEFTPRGKTKSPPKKKIRFLQKLAGIVRKIANIFNIIDVNRFPKPVYQRGEGIK